MQQRKRKKVVKTMSSLNTNEKNASFFISYHCDKNKNGIHSNNKSKLMCSYFFFIDTVTKYS